MKILHEGIHVGEFLLSEGEGRISREQVELAVTAVGLPSGQVLALNAEGRYVPFDPELADDQPASALLYSPVDASEDPQPVSIIARLAEVAAARLTGFGPEAVASLLDRNIVVR
jgi:hypothetical protein